jgi:hypothetical protein
MNNISAKSLHSMRCLLCTRPTCLVFSVSSLKQQSMDRHATRTHYPVSEPTSLCSYSLNAAFLAEKQQYQFCNFGLTGPEPEHMINHNRGEHANHYTTAPDSCQGCMNLSLKMETGSDWIFVSFKTSIHFSNVL